MTTGGIKSTSFLIALLGAIWAWMVHSSNLEYYRQQKGEIPMDMILTADDASYITPAWNFYTKGVWKDNSKGVSSYVQRPPMVGMINWVFLHFTDSGNCQKYLSTILHGMAILVFGLMCIGFFGKKAGIILQCMYALVPCFWGYLFYFLTESITPSLLVFLLYAFYKFQQKNSPKWLFFQGFIIGVLLLTRPQLAMFVLPFFYFLWVYFNNKFHHKWLVVFVSLIMAFGGFTFWQIRSVQIAGEWKGIHPIYDSSNISEYRPVHRSFGNLFRIWEHNGEKFHTTMGIFLDQKIPLNEASDIAMKSVPGKVYHYIEPNDMRDLFTRYGNHLHAVYKEQKSGESSQELNLRKDVDKLTVTLRKKMWKENYLITPLHSMQWMFTKSQLNLLIFQKKFRGEWWMEGLRYFCVILIFLLTLLSLSQIANAKNKMLLLMATGTIAYLFYLFFIQKINEERYLFPLLPVFLFMAFDRINRWLNRSKI